MEAAAEDLPEGPLDEADPRSKEIPDSEKDNLGGEKAQEISRRCTKKTPQAAAKKSPEPPASWGAWGDNEEEAAKAKLASEEAKEGGAAGAAEGGLQLRQVDLPETLGDSLEAAAAAADTQAAKVAPEGPEVLATATASEKAGEPPIALSALKLLDIYTVMVNQLETSYDQCVKDDQFKQVTGMITRKKAAIKELCDNMKALRQDMVSKHKAARTTDVQRAGAAVKQSLGSTGAGAPSDAVHAHEYAFNLSEQMVTIEGMDQWLTHEVSWEDRVAV
jgi:hypothetical protein